MSQIASIIGQRIRSYRQLAGLSQEKVAELAGCHPTYVGQVERGEKNATIEGISKISHALGVPLSKLFENIDDTEDLQSEMPSKCYDLILSRSLSEQEQTYQILVESYKLKEME